MILLNPGGRMAMGRLFLAFAPFVPHALADFGSCQSGWEWANNSLQQNPCEMAGALDAACGGFSLFVYGPLPQGDEYPSPQVNDSLGQKCNCNTVVFGLLMACTACQNVTPVSWTYWSQFCVNVSVTQYPERIPLKTAIPHWAYLNYTIGDGFNSVAARAAGGTPESFAPAPSTIPLSPTSTSSSPSSSTTGSPSSIRGSPSSATVNPTSQGDNNNLMKKSSNVGAIVGGVIGGLVAVGIGAWIYLRIRAMEWGDKARSDKVGASTGSSLPEHVIPHLSIRPYDPSDPSTYPTHLEYRPTGLYSYPAAPNRGNYNGDPEL